MTLFRVVLPRAVCGVLVWRDIVVEVAPYLRHVAARAGFLWPEMRRALEAAHGRVEDLGDAG